MGYEEVLEHARALSPQQRRELVEALRAQVMVELGEGDRAPSRCPRCGCPHVVRKGRAGGCQRWACRGCGRTFSAKTMGLLGYSKLAPGVWAACVEGAVAGRSLRELAAACGVCLSTSWFMRMRLCEVMALALPAFRSGPAVSCQVDGTYLDESLSGNRARARVAMPRPAHRRGGAVRARGISSPRVCVVCAANDLGDEPCELADRGRPTDAALRAALGRSVAGSLVATDDHAGYARVLPGLGVAAHEATRSSEATHGELGMVNAMHGRPEAFLARFNGVSTRRLGRYLSWFLWEEQARRAGSDREATLSGQAACGRYESTRRGLAEEPQPFFEYWTQAMSTVV
jgi:transposase-like protein